METNMYNFYGKHQHFALCQKAGTWTRPIFIYLQILQVLQVLIILHGHPTLVTLQLYYEIIADSDQC